MYLRDTRKRQTKELPLLQTTLNNKDIDYMKKDYEPPKQNITLEWWPTPTELAKVFIGEMSDYQASFFNEVARLTDEWEAPHSFPMQLQFIIDQEHMHKEGKVLNKDGRRIMQKIGEYGNA